MTTTTQGARTMTAADRRNDAIRTIFLDVPVSVSDWTDADYALVLDRMTRAAGLGRTEAWKDACGFAARMIAEGHPRHWSVLQGSVVMSWAA